MILSDATEFIRGAIGLAIGSIDLTDEKNQSRASCATPEKVAERMMALPQPADGHTVVGAAFPYYDTYGRHLVVAARNKGADYLGVYAVTPVVGYPDGEPGSPVFFWKEATVTQFELPKQMRVS